MILLLGFGMGVLVTVLTGLVVGALSDPHTLIFFEQAGWRIVALWQVMVLATVAAAWGALYFLRRLPHVGVTLHTDILTCQSVLRHASISLEHLRRVRIDCRGNMEVLRFAWTRGSIAISGHLVDPRDPGMWRIHSVGISPAVIQLTRRLHDRMPYGGTMGIGTRRSSQIGSLRSEIYNQKSPPNL